MENLLSKINVSNKTCCLMGDFNIDLAQENYSSLTFRNMLLSNSFYNTIDKPTRITSRSVSLIDNIFSNIHRDTLHSGILYSDISHHLPIFLTLSNIISNKASRPPKIVKRKITPQCVDQLKADLMLENWVDVVSCQDTTLLENVYPMGKHFNQRLVGIGSNQLLGKGFNQLGLVNF